MKNKFEFPILEIVNINNENIISTSGDKFGSIYEGCIDDDELLG